MEEMPSVESSKPTLLARSPLALASVLALVVMAYGSFRAVDLILDQYTGTCVAISSSADLCLTERNTP